MVHMAAQYGHFSLHELRGAAESISGAGIEGSGIEARPLVFPPLSEQGAKTKRPN